jgi:4-phytase / acid phosphatase
MFSPRPYPDFGVPTGYLIALGQQAGVLLGTYFRQYLLAEGLLTGDAGTDMERSYFRANSIQRSNLTATMFGEGLIPSATIPVHSYSLGQPDPVFDPIPAGVAAIDASRAANEVQEVYNSGTALAAAYSAGLSLIRGVLFNYQNGTQYAARRAEWHHRSHDTSDSPERRHNRSGDRKRGELGWT